jgi:hypothetical protein
MNYKLSDFKVGQIAYMELTGNASRGRHAKEELILACTVESIGRKYVTANGIKFEEHNSSYCGLKEHTSHCVDFVLYPNKKDIEDKFEKEDLIKKIRGTFTGYSNAANNLPLEKLRKIYEVINS